MSSGTHLCLKWSQQCSWWYISTILIKIPSRDVCGKMRKQKRPNHRHKQISIPSAFSCYKHHWQILHQFFQFMEMFPISFSLFFIRHPMHKSPFKGEPMPTFFEVIFCFAGRGSGPLCRIHQLMYIESHVPSWVLWGLFFSRTSLARLLGIAAGRSVDMHWSTPPLSDRNDQTHLPSRSQVLHHWERAGLGDTRGTRLNF